VSDPEALDGPALFEVGVIALSHSGTPMSDTALEYVRQAVHGDLDAVVPYAAVYGAHHILCAVYNFTVHEATHVLTNFLSAEEIHWYAGPNAQQGRAGLDVAGEHNINGWDGYYATVAREEGIGTVITVDTDFDRIDGLNAVIPLSKEERNQFTTYFKNTGGDSGQQ
jgi:predicted nucleic acid-binding protein